MQILRPNSHGLLLLAFATLTVTGKYPIVSHSFAYTELGVVGVLDVTE